MIRGMVSYNPSTGKFPETLVWRLAMPRKKTAKESVSRIKRYLEEANLEYSVTDEGMIFLFNGSAIVCVEAEVHSTGEEFVQVFSVVVSGARMGEKLFRKLLQLNNVIHFGAFCVADNLIIFRHKLLGGSHMDSDEFLYALRSVAVIADEYDDKIISEFGGRTAVGSLEDHRRELDGSSLVW